MNNFIYMWKPLFETNFPFFWDFSKKKDDFLKWLFQVATDS